MSSRLPDLQIKLSVFEKSPSGLIFQVLPASLSIARLVPALVALTLMCGCFSARTPFDFPHYPAKANLVNIVEGYQDRVSANHFSMWANDLEDRYTRQHLQIDNQYLYAAQCGLTIFDISQPESITVVGDYPATCGVDALAIVDGRAYLAARDQGVTVLDVAIPAKPKLIGMYDYSTGATSPQVGLVVRGSCLYLYAPTSKLPPGHISQENLKAETYTGWYMENPFWQVLKLHNHGNTISLKPVGTLTDIGRPRTSLANYLYTATKWTESGNDFNTTLQTVELLDDCGMRVVNTQLVPAMINDMKVSGTVLFGAVGNTIWAWDVTVPQQPVKVESIYNASGRIGDFITIDVNESILLGRGYALKYKRGADQVHFRLYARLEGGNGPCMVWMKPEQRCKSQFDEQFRGVDTGRGSVLHGDYVFYPYAIATDPLVEDEFVLVDHAIMIYKLP